MTKFTPESLARTDFACLVRHDPAAARERLAALIADPEALALYGEQLAWEGVADPRFGVLCGCDDLRRRILCEGLRQAVVDDETLVNLAADFELLVEIQFDLFSTEAPRSAWLKVLDLDGDGDNSILFFEEPKGQEFTTGSAGQARKEHEHLDGEGATSCSPVPMSRPMRTAPSPQIFTEVVIDGRDRTSTDDLINLYYTCCADSRRFAIDRRNQLQTSGDLAADVEHEFRLVLSGLGGDDAVVTPCSTEVEVRWIRAHDAVHLALYAAPAESGPRASRSRELCFGRPGLSDSWFGWLRRWLPCVGVRKFWRTERSAASIASTNSWIYCPFPCEGSNWSQRSRDSFIVLVHASPQAHPVEALSEMIPESSCESGCCIGHHLTASRGSLTKRTIMPKGVPAPSASREPLEGGAQHNLRGPPPLLFAGSRGFGTSNDVHAGRIRNGAGVSQVGCPLLRRANGRD